ncbi:MAG: hypothetical protein KDA89_08760 [Planctomycetaceae bacterium]|nr:hypothetical protein [Planctomycetaceae bacterium]
MKGTITSGLQILARGLSPYVAEKLRAAFGENWPEAGSIANVINSPDPEQWDAQVVLVLMWENWNRVFRQDLSFVERSLVSELREFRNRWAHQQHFSLRDTYRCMDGIERLLRSVGSEATENADELRREALKLLHDDELIETSLCVRDWFTAAVSAVCGFLIVVVVLEYLRQPISWVLAALTTVVFARFVFRTMTPQVIVNTGPRQCGGCARVYYGNQCPYCHQTTGRQRHQNAVSVTS